MAYSIAANYAHNTGRMLIGDPSGVNDTALRRLAELMLSSALKFGTTDHLAPHTLGKWPAMPGWACHHCTGSMATAWATSSA